MEWNGAENMKVGLLPIGEPGIYRSLLLPEVADALAVGEPITALVVSLDGKAFGAIAGYLENNNFRITSLYVVPEYRRRGGGRLLIETLIRITENKALGIKFRFTTTSKEHETLVHFLDALGFEQKYDKGLGVYLTTVGKLANSNYFKGCKERIGVPFSDLDKRILISAEKYAKRYHNELPTGGLMSKLIDKDVSFATVQNDKLVSYLIVDHSWSEGLSLCAVCVDKSQPQELYELLRSCIAAMREKYPPETKYVTRAFKKEGVLIKDKLFSGVFERISYSYSYSLLQ